MTDVTVESKIKLIQDIVTLTKKLVAVPDDQLGMNEFDSCAFTHVHPLAAYVSHNLRLYGLEDLSRKLFAVNGTTDRYPEPTGDAAKIEFCKRATDVINTLNPEYVQ